MTCSLIAPTRAEPAGEQHSASTQHVDTKKGGADCATESMQASTDQAPESMQVSAELDNVATESEKVSSAQDRATCPGKGMLVQVVINDNSTGVEALTCTIEYKSNKATDVVEGIIKPKVDEHDKIDIKTTSLPSGGIYSIPKNRKIASKLR